MQSEMPGPQRGTTTSDKPDSVLVKIMDTGEFSDLTFVCNGEEFKGPQGHCVHAVRAAESSSPGWLPTLLTRAMQESHTGTISMDSFHVQTVKHFVQFMYTGDYDSNDPPDDDRYPGSASFDSDRFPTHMIDPRNAPQWTAGGESSTMTATASAPSPTAAASFLDHIRANSAEATD
ncbi:predicted protein [Aspergillus terreus NIH2624]|uniref:BTB domain-containing protein n=1 Tax=Aspergillus terreus (strain NIH 2624 / FGSC A1156) TaxID=341663 RepID=Q0CX99_ASPTN|nr:uncharacterized protein ATEG_01685 [Aspergillus terreus NIH2624]EAU38442.1 predicted protein [Aspergillus terreus NIH2624]